MGCRAWPLRRLLISAAAGCLALAGARASGLVLGVCEGDPIDALRAYQPLAAHLEEQLNEPVQLVAVDGPYDADRRLRKEKLDILFADPLVALAVHELGGGRIELRRWRAGRAEVAGVVFALSDAPAVLEGRILALDRERSTFGNLLAKLTLARRGSVLLRRASAADFVRPDAVGYVVAGSAESVVAWVLHGKAAAGAVREDLLRRHAGATGMSRLRVIAKTPALPPGLVAFRASLDPSRAAALRQALEGMHETPRGKRVLEVVDRTTRFDPVPEEVKATLAGLRNFTREELLQ